MAQERGLSTGVVQFSLSSSSLSLPQHDQDTDTVRETVEVKTESRQGGHGPAGESRATTEHHRRREEYGSAEEESYKYTQRVQGHRHLVKESREQRAGETARSTTACHSSSAEKRSIL
ncbi:unnamed protein product [Pleuronectes platessa]|uniref:Uncharacterized protein n=1 Tax=Pleuronectes platessa TaxID=8262 RepID=A0A9N7UE53_PLEPL|nr:unnamed protein product [Pleuronectes platessa]